MNLILNTSYVKTNTSDNSFFAFIANKLLEVFHQNNDHIVVIDSGSESEESDIPGFAPIVLISNLFNKQTKKYNKLNDRPVVYRFEFYCRRVHTIDVSKQLSESYY